MSNLRQFRGLRHLASKNTSTTVGSTTTETTLWSFTLPANTLRANGSLLVDLFGTWLGNSGSGGAHTLRFRFKFGAATPFDVTFTVPSTNGNSRFWYARAMIKNANSTGNQNISVFWIMEDQISSAAFATTTGATATRSIAHAESTTADVTVSVTAQPGTNSANLNAVIMGGTALLIR